MNKIYIHQAITLMAAVAACYVTFACSGDDPVVTVITPNDPNPDPEVVEKVLNSAAMDWNMTRDDVIAHMVGYNQISQADNSILQFNAPKSSQSISYRFSGGKLCATAILIPSASVSLDLKSLLDGYSLVGSLNGGIVYENLTANTMATVWQPLDQDSTFSAVGFAPIASDAYAVVEPISVETREAFDVQAKTVTLSGSVSGVDTQVEVGIIYGTDSNLTENEGLRKGTTSQGDFTINVDELGSETTYYYRAYASVDEVYYLGEVKSFTTKGYASSFTFNGTTYKMILVEGCSTGDFYIMDKEIPGTAFDINGDEVVSYNECRNRIDRLRETLGGMPLRIPRVNEWQYAAKGGNKSKGYKYSGSNNINEVAWYSGNSNGVPHAIGTKKPNELGIYDMSGNWTELCVKTEDVINEDYYCWYTHVCGGSSNHSENYCRVTSSQIPPTSGNWRNCFWIYDSSKDYGHVGIRLVYTKGR